MPWSRLGQEPVQVYLDRICILVEPATQVVGCYEDDLLQAKKNLVRVTAMQYYCQTLRGFLFFVSSISLFFFLRQEMERKLLEARQHQTVEVVGFMC